MRKADYQTLAQLLLENLAVAQDNKTAAEASRSGSQWARGDELETRTILLARAFAGAASVDREAFLKACGVT